MDLGDANAICLDPVGVRASGDVNHVPTVRQMLYSTPKGSQHEARDRAMDAFRPRRGRSGCSAPGIAAAARCRRCVAMRQRGGDPLRRRSPAKACRKPPQQQQRQHRQTGQSGEPGPCAALCAGGVAPNPSTGSGLLRRKRPASPSLPPLPPCPSRRSAPPRSM